MRTYLQQLYNTPWRARDYGREEILICRISELQWLNLRVEFDLDLRSESEKYIHIHILQGTRKILPDIH